MDRALFLSYLRGNNSPSFDFGHELEDFFAGVHATPQGYLDHLERVLPDPAERAVYLQNSGFGYSKFENAGRPSVSRPRIPYAVALKESAAIARERGLDHLGLSRQQEILAPYLFTEVKNRLPADQRHCLEMMCTIGLSLDYDHSTDVIIILGCSLVRIDMTVDMGEPDPLGSDQLKFTQYDVQQRPLARFASRVVEKLVDPNNRRMCGLKV